jgi:hypothetical protein
LHQFFDLLFKGCDEFSVEESRVIINLLFWVGHSILQGFLGLISSGIHGEGLVTNGGVGMETMGLKIIGTQMIMTKVVPTSPPTPSGLTQPLGLGSFKSSNQLVRQDPDGTNLT